MLRERALKTALGSMGPRQLVYGPRVERPCKGTAVRSQPKTRVPLSWVRLPPPPPQFPFPSAGFRNSIARPRRYGSRKTWKCTPADLVRVAKEFGFEGIVAKRADSFYESGKRSGAWVKDRANKGQEFVIGGYVPNNPLESIIVGYYNGRKLLYAGKVRNGFVPYTRREVFAKLRGLKIDTCPFANLPEKKRTQWSLTKEEMKNCVWLKPEPMTVVQGFNSSKVQALS